MRADKPLPGDLVIRSREDASDARRRVDVWVVIRWPDTEVVVGGPYQSYPYALQQAGHRIQDRSVWVWRDHAAPGSAERLELVRGDVRG